MDAQVVLATDGLFDNMDEEMMLELIHRWHGDRDNRHRPSSSEELAQQLVDKALELSLDKSIDSPFATLAKENDIMWSGGMPDDITVICMQVKTVFPSVCFVNWLCRWFNQHRPHLPLRRTANKLHEFRSDEFRCKVAKSLVPAQMQLQNYKTSKVFNPLRVDMFNRSFIALGLVNIMYVYIVLDSKSWIIVVDVGLKSIIGS